MALVPKGLIIVSISNQLLSPGYNHNCVTTVLCNMNQFVPIQYVLQAKFCESFFLVLNDTKIVNVCASSEDLWRLLKSECLGSL